MDFFGVKMLWIELSANPVQHFLVSFVMGIFYGFQKIFVPADTSGIFRRTGAFPGQTSGVLDIFFPG